MAKKILKVIADIFTGFLFVILILTIVAKINMLKTGNDYFNMFGYSIFKVTTGSMEPVIHENDIIIVKEKDSFKKDDIVTYKSGNAYITHRIINISGSVIITKGDANNTADGEINESDIIGVVVKILPKMGIWQQIFTTPKIVIGLFITLLLFDIAFSYKGKDEKKKVSGKEIVEFLEEEEKKEKTTSKKNDYTVRLDLNQIRKNIDSKINKK